ncbi:hypothetical protein ACH4LN_19775 [Streptomyces albus]|uniref:Uncharacterized protein n=1 Tax=Streptomyces albus TaxID=1888 RepID=A0A8H1LAB4_9ACTN|nr:MULTISPECIES: hypothetical protein [Streptomyces]TGG79702.1 hypothetical protein D8771_23505 [Streptomyces albus]UVN58704.1 hypothetical protein NR995_32340 [Streptomyces albus]GHJ21352.1 hypothetical protein TPA0909_29660 [Streptomyces albus]
MDNSFASDAGPAPATPESSVPAPAAPASGAGGTAGRRRTPVEWLGRAALACAALLLGAFLWVFGPLLAISCSSCQDGVRAPSVFVEGLLVVVVGGVPMIALGTVIAVFAARRGARAGGIGLGALALLTLVLLMSMSAGS